MNDQLPHSDSAEGQPRKDAAVKAVIEAAMSPQARLELSKRTWDVFKAKPVDAQLFIQLLAVCGGHAVEATVLWDLVIYQRGRGLETWINRSAMHYLDEYGSFVLNERAVQRAIESLTEQQLIEQWQVPKTIAKRFRLNWACLEEQLSQVSPQLPGLREMAGE